MVKKLNSDSGNSEERPNTSQAVFKVALVTDTTSLGTASLVPDSAYR